MEIFRDDSPGDPMIRDQTSVARYVPADGLPSGTYRWRATVDGTTSGEGVFKILSPQFEVVIPTEATEDEVRRLVLDATRESNARVVFPENGNLLIRSPGFFLELENVENLIIDGRGTKITFSDPTAGVARMRHCRNVTFKDLIIEHEPKPFTVARVLDVNQQTGELRLQVEASHPPLDAPHVLQNWSFCSFLDPQIVGRLLVGSPLVPSLRKDTLKKQGEYFTVQATSAAMVSRVSIGDRVVQFARNPGGRSLFHSEQSHDLVFLRILNHSSSGGHYLMLECDNSRVLKCVSRPARGYLFGGNADGVHVRSARGGPWVEGCHFEAIGDDGVALFSKGISILRVRGRRELLLDQKFFNLREGDEIIIFDPLHGQPRGRSCFVTHVRAVKNTSGKILSYWITLDRDLPKDLSIRNKDAWNNDQVFNMSAQHSGFVVRRNSFHSVRRYGIIVRGRDGAIEDNLFEGVSDSAITLQNEPNFWQNGLHSERVIIARNTINSCNFSEHARGRGAIHVALRAIADVNDRWSQKPAQWLGHKNITIAFNTISKWRGIALNLENVTGLRVEGNRITQQLDEDPDFPRCIPIRIDQSQEVILIENFIEKSDLDSPQSRESED